MALPDSGLAVACGCPFVPPEWVRAHGVRPVRPVLDDLPAAVPMGVCGYAAGYAWALARAPVQAAVFTTTCDQMRRVAETIGRECPVPSFLFHVPATWQTAGACGLYRSELERLGRFLCRLGGAAPDRNTLVEVMEAYDAARRRLRDARGWLTGRALVEAIRAIHQDPETALDTIPMSGPMRKGIPLATAGPELTEGLLGVLDFIEARGGRIALDGTTTGERSLVEAFDRRALGEDPLGVLIDAYFGGVPCAFRRPNTLLYQWLKREMTARDVRGILFIRRLWCDMWAAEECRMREWASVPLTAVDAEDDGVTVRMATRLESFLEALR